MAKRSQQLIGYTNVLLSATFMASLPVLGKLAYSTGMGPIDTLMLRYMFAFLLLAGYLFFILRKPVITKSPIIIAQGICLFVASIFYFLTLQYLSAGLTNVIFFTHPALVALMAIFVYREKLTTRLVIGIILALIGITLIAGIGGVETVSYQGIALGVIASSCYAIYILIGQKSAGSTEPLTLTCTLSLISVILLSTIFYDHLPTLIVLTPYQIFIGCITGLLATVLAVTFLMRGISMVGASRGSLVSSAEPAITLLIAFIILGEILSLREFAGSVLVMASILFVVTARVQKTAD